MPRRRPRSCLPSQPALRVVPMPADANQHGDIFGGWVMSQVDIAGGVVAAKRARGRVATVAVNSFVFREPVLIGDVVSLYAEIRRVGRTSITVDVEVYAQRNPTEVICVKVTEASLTYVAVGPDRRPRELPPGVSAAASAQWRLPKNNTPAGPLRRARSADGATPRGGVYSRFSVSFPGGSRGRSLRKQGSENDNGFRRASPRGCAARRQH